MEVWDGKKRVPSGTFFCVYEKKTLILRRKIFKGSEISEISEIVKIEIEN